ncbi:hypothetical protein CH063_04095 [Colletotrichum higginsianum]|uniref:Uncharacterized protein n=1 Tax=Colletotrichum higginsianum (strain IMI 349063) TaxID=759273 RepID=H1W430_COLHI|nr:hypothetical protein CH063_04095 [Colletotrichum higginsianum]
MVAWRQSLLPYSALQAAIQKMHRPGNVTSYKRTPTPIRFATRHLCALRRGRENRNAGTVSSARFTLESLGPVRSKEARDALIGVEWSRSAGTQRFHIEEPGFGNQSSAVVGMGGSGMCLSAPAYPFELHSHGQIASRRGVVGPPLTSVDAISAELNCVTEIGLRMRWLVGHAV